MLEARAILAVRGYNNDMPANKKNADFAPLPSTLERSPKHAQDIYEKTLESAEATYKGDEARAHRAAWGAVKHSFEKIEDHWEPKDQPGPSDPRSRSAGPHPAGASYGGVEMLSRSKQQLVELAHERGIKTSAKMTKSDLAQAIEAANDRATRKARNKSGD